MGSLLLLLLLRDRDVFVFAARASHNVDTKAGKQVINREPRARSLVSLGSRLSTLDSRDVADDDDVTLANGLFLLLIRRFSRRRVSTCRCMSVCVCVLQFGAGANPTHQLAYSIVSMCASVCVYACVCVCVSQAFSFLAFLQLPVAFAFAVALAVTFAFAASCLWRGGVVPHSISPL